MSIKTRAWIFGGALLCGVLLLYGVLGGLLPQLTSAESTHSLATSAEDQNGIYETQLQALEASASRTDELKEEVARLRVAIPETAASRELLGQLSDIEQSTGVRITSFTLEEAAEGAPAEEAAEAAQAEADASGDESQASQAGASTDPPTVSGVQRLGFTMSFSGASREAVTAFIREVQSGDRLLAFDHASFELGNSDDEWTGTIAGALFVIPGSGAEPAA